MKRAVLLVPALTAVLVGSQVPIHAASPQIQDAVGDTAVASQDIVSGLFSITNGQLQGDLALQQAPATGVPSTYAIGLYPGNGCATYTLQYDWKGVASQSSAHLDWYASDTCSTTPVSPTTSVPATLAVAGNVLTISAPLPSALPAGTVVAGYAETTNGLILIPDPSKGNGSTTIGGDIAYSNGRFALG